MADRARGAVEVAAVTRVAALALLGLTVHDVPPMHARMVARIRHANAKLMESFR